MLQPAKPNRRKAYSVHLLTATGAVFAMLALLAAVEEKWSLMYLWLVVALAVDGIDGPLARRYDVATFAPRFDGALLDLIIDYLTYVFIPAYALYTSGLMDGWSGWLALGVITFASALYFCDTGMKTRDYSFAGFPGCWNMAVLVLFAVTPPWWVSLIAVVVLTVAMFLPLKFIHPTRTKRWRAVSLPVSVAWIVLAGWAAWSDFNLPQWGQVALVISTLYLSLAGIAQQILYGPEG